MRFSLKRYTDQRCDTTYQSSNLASQIKAKKKERTDKLEQINPFCNNYCLFAGVSEENLAQGRKMLTEEIIAITDSPSESLLERLSKKKLAIYGVGQGYFTFKTFVLDKFGIEVDLFIDIKFNKIESFENTIGVSPNSLSRIDLSNYNVVVTNEESKFKGIKNDLIQYSEVDVYSAFEFYEYHLAYAEEKVIYGGYDYYLRFSDEIQQAYNNLSDQESKTTFRHILELYMTKKVKKFDHRNIREQYLSVDVGNIDYSRIVSCGAFDGDSVKSFVEHHGELDNIILFEPDLKNFRKLSDFLSRTIRPLSKSILALPLAVGDKIGFEAMCSAGTNSSISGGGDVSVMKVALDDIIRSDDCSFINMDIEGGEFNALIGAEKLIRNSKPSLAISIYHRPDDLWRICLFLSGLELGYNFFIRNYTGYPAETLLYATLPNVS